MAVTRETRRIIHKATKAQFPTVGKVGVKYEQTDLDIGWWWDAETNAYVRPEQDVIDRVTNLEEINYVKKVYEEITGTTTGQVTDYSPTTIDQTNWANIEDNAQVKAIDGSGDITAGDVYTSTGAKVRAVVASNRTYTLTGTPTALKYVIIWQLRGTAKDIGDANIPSSVSLGTITDTQAISENTLERQIALGTCVNYGGIISVNAVDDTKFDRTAGLATIVDNYTDPTNPTVTIRDWEDEEGITVTGLNSQFLTFPTVIASGFAQLDESTAYDIERDNAPLGVIVHTNLTSIEEVGPYTNWGKDTVPTMADIMNSIGPRLNLSGNVIKANGANLYIDKTAGLMFGLGANYGVSRKDPNRVTIDAVEIVQFLTLYRNAFPGGAVEVDTGYYDPNGDGTLVAIPSGNFVTHRIYYDPSTNLTGLQYSQYTYDSLKKASLSWEQEVFEKSPVVNDVELRGIIVVQQGTTELNNTDKAKFIDIGMLGEKSLNPVPGFSEFAEPIEILDGMSYQRPSITFVNNGGIIYLDLEAVGGGDIIYIFEQREFVLDCTTGDGVSGRARIALTAGASFDAPIQNYITVTRSGAISILQASTTFPTGQFGWVNDVLLPDATTFDSRGVYSSQRYSDNKSHDGRGAMSYEREKIRSLGTTYKSGVVPTITITDLTPDTVDFETTEGEIYQMLKDTMPALDSATDGIFIINHPTTPWLYVTDIGTIDYDANGDTLNNTSFNFVFIGIKSTSNGVAYSHLGLILPNGSYNYLSLSQALTDEENTAVTSVPTSIKKTAFLIARVTFKYKNGVWNNVTEEETAVTFFDLRGLSLGATTGGAGTPSLSTFSDATFQIFNNTDTTKFIKFDASAVTTGTTRTLTVPDKSGTIALVREDSALAYYSQEMYRGNAVAISCYGDSTMYGYEVGTGSQVTLPAPLQLQNMLRAYYDNTNITTDNNGVSGQTIDDVIATFATTIASDPAKIIYMNWAINDADAIGNDVVQFRLDYIEAIRIVRDAGKIPIIETPNVVLNDDTFGTDQRADYVKQYAETIRDVANEYNVTLIDIYEITQKYWSDSYGTTTNSVIGDGYHPMDSYYRAIGTNMAIPFIVPDPLGIVKPQVVPANTGNTRMFGTYKDVFTNPGSLTGYSVTASKIVSYIYIAEPNMDLYIANLVWVSSGDAIEFKLNGEVLFTINQRSPISSFSVDDELLLVENVKPGLYILEMEDTGAGVNDNSTINYWRTKPTRKKRLTNGTDSGTGTMIRYEDANLGNVNTITLAAGGSIFDVLFDHIPTSRTINPIDLKFTTTLAKQTGFFVLGHKIGSLSAPQKPVGGLYVFLDQTTGFLYLSEGNLDYTFSFITQLGTTDLSGVSHEYGVVISVAGTVQVFVDGSQVGSNYSLVRNYHGGYFGIWEGDPATIVVSAVNVLGSN